jgi:voltage-gated potassium channel
MSLLLREPRTATIRAGDYCDLYTLDKKTFDLIIERYPDFLDKINLHVKKIQGELEHQR